MTFPLGEYLVLKMKHYHHFEKNAPVVELAHMALPTGAGFDVVLDEGKIESQRVWKDAAS
jgi:L-rhamnonate dehydratase